MISSGILVCRKALPMASATNAARLYVGMTTLTVCRRVFPAVMELSLRECRCQVAEVSRSRDGLLVRMSNASR